MTIIFSQCNKATRVKIPLGSSYEDNLEAGELMKSLARVWFDAHEDFYSWYYTQETMENNKEWDKPPNILEDIGVINESMNEHIKPDFYISERQS